MRDGTTSIITWCQPPDSMAGDIIVIDGQVIDAADTAARQHAVSQINEVARVGKRTDLPNRGWKSVTRSTAAAQVPVQTDDPALRPSVAVLLPSLDARTFDRASAQVQQTAELAGYRADRSQVLEALRYEARPKGILARFLQWLLALFGIGAKQ